MRPPEAPRGTSTGQARGRARAPPPHRNDHRTDTPEKLNQDSWRAVKSDRTPMPDVDGVEDATRGR